MGTKKKQPARTKTHVKKGDTVYVLTGDYDYRHKTGKVLAVLDGGNRLLVENINMIKRHQRPSGRSQQGGIIEKEGSISASKVMLYCNKCSKPTRVKMKFLENDRKVRSCARCGEIVDRV
ncbi:MAG: 50S ribosomal protein L24 [bacterium]|jgi:large subunit ribosomal protein L24|nr:50S ribosomal protein L24 [bacterium]